MVCSETHNLCQCTWNMKSLPQQWKESVIIPTYKKSDKTDCSSYQCTSWLSAIYKMLSIILWRLIPYVDKINGDLQCKFWSNRSDTDIRLWDTWEKMGILWGSVWDIYRLKEGLWFDYKGGFVNYSGWDWYSHETS